MYFLSAWVCWYIDYKNLHGVNNIKKNSAFSIFFWLRENPLIVSVLSARISSWSDVYSSFYNTIIGQIFQKH
jgi:hypothetical protein